METEKCPSVGNNILFDRDQYDMFYSDVSNQKLCSVYFIPEVSRSLVGLSEMCFQTNLVAVSLCWGLLQLFGTSLPLK